MITPGRTRQDIEIHTTFPEDGCAHGLRRTCPTFQRLKQDFSFVPAYFARHPEALLAVMGVTEVASQ